MINNRDNKGFTLIELVVSTAIMSIIASSLALMVITSVSSYNNTMLAVAQQYDSQIVMAQLKNYLLNCNAGIVWEESEAKLMVINENRDESLVVHVFDWDEEEEALFYGTSSVETAEDVDAVEAVDIMCDDVMHFGFIAVDEQYDEVVPMGEVEVSVHLQNDDDLYEAVQSVALRNMPLYSGALDATFEELMAE